MNLALFDIDGTLLDNTATEDACFVHALQTGLGLDNIDRDWSTYAGVTDQGIATEAHKRARGKSPSQAALTRTIDHFLQGLADAYRHTPLRTVRGAEKLLTDLPRHGWTPALATGAWQRAALFKLRIAGLRADHLLLATAEDGPARVDVFRTALERARESIEGSGPRSAFDRVVLVGDGVWDVAVARGLGVPFVGCGDATGAGRLRDAGARTVIHDFSDGTAVLDSLRTAVCL